ncbi:fumarylacetoacetate hydrolase [Phlyctema vagabunda]|uniref:Fumarylacetoacetate hydrolase n=1 Tax=Phlyctema vagabunda TaxID=108571 RepID=A0ABR4P3E9_9HELO
MATFSRLVRFLAKDGRTYYGDAILPASTTAIEQAQQARVIKGDIFGAHSVTDEVKDIRLLLAPLAPEDVKTVRCLGLNYAEHAREVRISRDAFLHSHCPILPTYTILLSSSPLLKLQISPISTLEPYQNRAAANQTQPHQSKMPIPKYPVVFYKPATSLSGPTDAIPIHAMAQEGTGLDYECELVVVIGKACADVPEARALDYVLGYAVGNDVSHREWQIQRGGGQWSLGKGFDGWAPWGPGIVSASLIQDPQALRIGTTLNGVQVQESNTRDQIFGVAQTIAFLSQGTTLLPGDLIFTGTPQGVGMGRTPQLWLRDGDRVQVGVEGIGACTNTVEFTKPKAKL